MHRRHVATILFLTLFSTLLAANASTPTPKPPQPQQTLTTLNVDGDLSLTPEQNRICWNSHSTGLTNASTWTITFQNETEIHLQTAPNEAGHIATGAWWTTSFKTKNKIPLYTTQPTQIQATFRVDITNITLQQGNEWLRIALASATQRDDGSVVYTETDFYDSPTAQQSPNGNTQTGGNTIYRGGNVVEYKTAQATLNDGEPTHST
jgi:hypothetical protein